MNAKDYDEGIQKLRFHLYEQLRTNYEKFDLNFDAEDLSDQFQRLIRRIAQKTNTKVVVLIDEYDKALNATLHLPEIHSEIKSTLKAFYEVLKSADEYLRFTFITGISKFSQVSLFSSLNHFNDISLDQNFATICGLTEDELFSAYQEEIQDVAKANELSIEATKESFKQWYNGYLFHPKATGVYNPFSTIHAIKQNEFKDFWFSTGDPDFSFGIY